MIVLEVKIEFLIENFIEFEVIIIILFDIVGVIDIIIIIIGVNGGIECGGVVALWATTIPLILIVIVNGVSIVVKD